MWLQTIPLSRKKPLKRLKHGHWIIQESKYTKEDDGKSVGYGDDEVPFLINLARPTG